VSSPSASKMSTGTPGSSLARYTPPTQSFPPSLLHRLSTEHHRLVELIREVEFPGSLAAEREEGLSKKRPAGAGMGTVNKQATKKARGGVSGEASVAVSSSKRAPVIADMMGGVGPFGIPLAKLDLFRVHCNDLNPASHKYLLQNARLNHCRLATTVEESAPGLSCHNLDGREFIRCLREAGVAPDHVLMNLPQSAPEFLDTFIGYFRPPLSASSSESAIVECPLPVIHVYAFSTAVEDLPISAIADVSSRCASVMRCSPEELGRQQVIAATGTNLANLQLERLGKDPSCPPSFFSEVCWGHIVRDVAPTKVMVCLSFRLPRSVALSLG
jgi:tRNA G37 N-methylase Trm5